MRTLLGTQESFSAGINAGISELINLINLIPWWWVVAAPTLSALKRQYPKSARIPSIQVKSKTHVPFGY